MRKETLSDAIPAPRTAAEWFLTINTAEEPAAHTVQEWLRWLDASEENRQAFEEVARIWHRTPSAVIARRTSRADREDYDGSMPVHEWRAARASRWARRWTHRSTHRSTIRGRPFALAAAAAIGAIVVLLYWQLTPTALSDGEFATTTAEHRQLRLADGSRVTLGGHSRLTVNLSSTTREIRLDSGEAYFAVNKDPKRPFTVLAFDGAITALGTAFNVRTAQDRVTVTVTEGSVQIADTAEAGPPSADGRARGKNNPLRIERGEQLSYTKNEALPALAASPARRVDANESVRWREGWLVYRDEPLKYVIADITRYTELQLSVADDAADLQFSGAVSRERIGEWIVALPEVAPVTVHRAGSSFDITARTPVQ